MNGLLSVRLGAVHGSEAVPDSRSCQTLGVPRQSRGITFLVITSGKAGGLEIVNRSKRLWALAPEPPKVAGTVKPGATQGGYFLNSANCSNRLSSASCC